MEGRLKEIKAIAFDVDGVFTDGGIIANSEGDLLRIFDSKDGFAMRMARMNGLIMAIITGGRSESIRERFLVCGVNPEDIYLGSRDKIEDFEDFCTRHSLKKSEVAFMGDDIPDIEPMLNSAIGICPSDAVEEVKDIADIIVERPGGKACVRLILERILKAQGRWNFSAKYYKQLF